MKRPSLFSVIALAGALTAGAVASFGQAQATRGVGVAGRAQVPIRAIEVQVEDLGTGQQLAPLAKGGELVLEIGQAVRLRMAAIPTGERSPRYPSTRFTAQSDSRVRTEAVNEQVGSITLKAHQGDQPGSATVVFYEILEPLQMDDSMRKGRVYVRVAAPVAPPAPEPAPQPQPQPPPGDRLGMTLYEHGEYRGRSQKFYGDQRDLRLSSVGNDAVSSIRIDSGCRAVLYEHQDFRGKSTVVTDDVSYLGGSQVGNDSLSSFELSCSAPETRRGAALFDAEDFRGTEEVFYREDNNLRDNRIGDDRVRSLKIDRGCQVTLYELPDFRGRSTYLDRDLDSLRGTEVGLDSVSSLRVDCR